MAILQQAYKCIFIDVSQILHNLSLNIPLLLVNVVCMAYV